MELYKSDFVLYNPSTNQLGRFNGGDIVIFGDKEEAEIDAYPDQIVTSCLDLPIELQNEIINQLKKHYEEN